MNTYIGTDCDENMGNMAWQDFRIRITETARQCLNAVAVAEIANITQQKYRHLGILHTRPTVEIRKLQCHLIRSFILPLPQNRQTTTILLSYHFCSLDSNTHPRHHHFHCRFQVNQHRSEVSQTLQRNIWRSARTAFLQKPCPYCHTTNSGKQWQQNIGLQCHKTDPLAANAVTFNNKNNKKVTLAASADMTCSHPSYCPAAKSQAPTVN